MADATVWKNGLPYEPEVRKLETRYEQLDEGIVIPHAEMEQLLGLPRSAKRYFGIINSWRAKLLRTRNIDTEFERGNGLKILPPEDRLAVSERDFHFSARALGRSLRRTTMVPRDRLNEVGKRRADHIEKRVAFAYQSVSEARKQLAIDLAPVKSLPKPQLGTGTLDAAGGEA